MNTHSSIPQLLCSFMALCLFNTADAGSPVWTFTPLTATTLSVPSNDTATVQYTVTNQSSRVHTLSMQPIQGITQLTTGLGVCGNPFVLTGKASCTLSLQVNGRQLTQPISDGPIVCEQGSTLQCYRPASANILHVTQAAAITDATITVTSSPLTLTTNGPTGTLTINNTSLMVTATNIESNFTGTALNGNVSESGNTCGSVLPLASCTLSYDPGSTVVSQTDFSIQGSNTNAVTAQIEIESGIPLFSVSPSSGPSSGGTGVTLTGSALVGATAVTFGGNPATSFNVVDSNTVTAVTPAHAPGPVDVVITTPSGNATSTNGYTYRTTELGESAYGGIIACLNGGLNNLIAATADNSTSIQWGGSGTNISSASSTTDGQTNTTRIVEVLGESSTYAARLCSNYEVDSQGKTPCESGNTCYSDWFLPASYRIPESGQLNCLYTNRAVVGGFDRAYYWSSTNANEWLGGSQDFDGGGQVNYAKFELIHVRCVRAFTP